MRAMENASIQIRINGKYGKHICSLNRRVDKEYDIGYAHITLVDYKLRRISRLIPKLEMMNGLKPFDVSVSGVGTWDNRWIYLRVKKNGGVKRLNELLYKEVRDGVSRDFRPNLWVPHITVSHSKVRFKKNLGEVKKAAIAFRVRVNTVYLVGKYRHGNYRILRRYKLGSKAVRKPNKRIRS
ncbi:MAG: 2'-5' RNA ligase family protein [Candidatus Micrarchaeota archaeon]|nr:2'-5' RNA ligase family protein [Candidatus Micrarchaeota archaeon]